MSLFNYSNLIDPLLKSLRAYNANLLVSRECKKSIDVCCGTGDQVFYYNEKGIRATGIDKREDMIKVANKRKEEEKIKDVSFQVANATDLPFENEYFDAGSISLGLHEMSRKERMKTISELKRVVKKGGTLLLADFHAPLPDNPIAYGLELIEYIAGEENYRCYREYLSQGGIPSLLSKNNLQKEKKVLFFFDLINLLITKKQ